MKNVVVKWLLMLVLLGLTFIAPSCSMFRKCDKKPDIIQYQIGLFDSLTAEGTQVVFESNTGKLDTLVYGKIIKDTSSYNLNPIKDYCKDQYVINYSDKQIMRFKHNLGLDSIFFHRGTGRNRSIIDKPSFWYFYSVEDNSYVTIRPFVHNLTFQDHHDVAILPILKKVTLDSLGSYIMSKSAGLLQVKYQDAENPADSVFTFKHFIK